MLTELRNFRDSFSSEI